MNGMLEIGLLTARAASDLIGRSTGEKAANCRKSQRIYHKALYFVLHLRLARQTTRKLRASSTRPHRIMTSCAHNTKSNDREKRQGTDESLKINNKTHYLNVRVFLRVDPGPDVGPPAATREVRKKGAGNAYTAWG